MIFKLLLIIPILFLFLSFVLADEIPNNLWMGLIAEDTSGNLNTYRVIASVVRNRLQNGLNSGLVALKRHDLTNFVAENYLYVLKTRGIDLEERAKSAIKEVFIEGKDYANGAIHYEHTGNYPVPSWAKNMKIVKVLYSDTKQELTLYKPER